jgi:hypothetical protein
MIQQGNVWLKGIEGGIFGFNIRGLVETIEPCMRGVGKCSVQAIQISEKKE